MGIRSIYVRRFRSVSSAALVPCGNFNILIGKNNAGKSNLFAAIELALRHLRDGSVAGPLRSPGPMEQFTDRDHTQPIRIGIEFDVTSEINQELRKFLIREGPHLEKSVDQVSGQDVVSFIITGVSEDGRQFAFLEQMGMGAIVSRPDSMEVNGIRLLSVNREVASELFANVLAASRLRKDIEFLESRSRQIPFDYIIRQPKEARFRAYMNFVRPEATQETMQELSTLLNSVNSEDELKSGISHLIEDVKERVEQAEKQEISGAISAFAGDTKTPPPYAKWLMQKFGGMTTLHVRETKRPIGKDEAKMLLDLKITRGGPKRFTMIQDMMRNLLGINLDAFQAEEGQGSAEMDIDDFLVQANGAGIRGALRIALDLELNSPQLALIEEPEVHMHPGLARVVASYLRDRSDKTQIFMTTHSTDFIDFVPFQNVFLISRDTTNHTISELLAADEAALRVPSELGLRLSSFFMFDRLIFVEGPSDEAVIRQLARNSNIELAKRNVGFVYMKGVRNFAHFAAQDTLDLLSRRRIRMWFLVDRDERDNTDVQRMITALGGCAKLTVLDCRELENSLLDPGAVIAFIVQKRSKSGLPSIAITIADVSTAIQEESAKLKDRAIALRIEKRLLQPVFMHSRSSSGSVAEKLESGQRDLTARIASMADVEREVTSQVNAEWPSRASCIAPGCEILGAVAKRFGTAFSKDKGDSEHIARLLPATSISVQLRELLEELSEDIESI